MSNDGAEVAVPLSIGEWLLSFWNIHIKQRESIGAIECIAEPGDCVFVPHGWWHMVINLDEFSIAITQNYVSTSNLSDVLRFLREKPEQISGLGISDIDKNNNIQKYNPNELYNIFIIQLNKFYPNLNIDEYIKISKEIKNKKITVVNKRKLSSLNQLIFYNNDELNELQTINKTKNNFTFSFY